MSRDIYFYTGGETKLQTPRFLAEIGYEMRNPTENDSQDLHVLLNTAFKDLPSHYEGARNQSFVQNLFKDKCFLWECSWLLFTETLAAACLLKRDEPSFLVYTIVVHPSLRGRGLGTFVLSNAVDSCKPLCEDRKLVSAYVDSKNSASLALFKKLGFR